MSDYIFPTLRGLTYPISVTPNWNTIKTRAVTGTQTFLKMYSYPWYNIKLQFSYLEDADSEGDDIQTLMGFYNNVGGSGNDFLFADSLFLDNLVNSQAFGTGDGISTKFRLIRTYGTFSEPIFGITSVPVVTSTIDGVTTVLTVNTDFTWTTKALITFITAPASGAILRWSGDWYYRCHFKEDTAEFQQIFYRGWGLDELNLESIKLL